MPRAHNPEQGACRSLQDLQRGSKILAADGNPVEVLKMEVQKTKTLLDLEIPGRSWRDEGNMISGCGYVSN
jgi:hypothetical protein